MDSLRRDSISVDDSVLQLADKIIECLLIMWNDLNNFAQSVAMNIFVKSVPFLIKGKRCEKYLHPFSCIIRNAVDSSNETHVYLMEDALNLWSVILVNLKQLDAHFMELYSSLLSVLDKSCENIRLLCSIFESYFLFNNQIIVEPTIRCWNSKLSSFLTPLSPASLLLMARMMDLFFQSFQTPPTTDWLIYFNGLVSSSDDFIIINACSIILSRLILLTPNICTHPSFQSIDKWIEYFDCLPSMKYKRLVGIALLILFRYGKVSNQNDYITSVCMTLFEDENGNSQDDCITAESGRRNVIMDFSNYQYFSSCFTNLIQEVKYLFNEEQMKDICFAINQHK